MVLRLKARESKSLPGQLKHACKFADTSSLRLHDPIRVICRASGVYPALVPVFLFLVFVL